MTRTSPRLGAELIQIGTGDPDLDTPAHIRAAATAAIEDQATHYTPHNGIPALRTAIAAHLSKSPYNLDYTPVRGVWSHCAVSTKKSDRFS